MTFRILSLDGGGTWALLEVMALRDLYPGESGHQILAHFDLAVANSGGSIVLAGLMLDFSADQIADFFQDQTKRESIFFKKPWFARLIARTQVFPRYVAARKRVGLAAAFGPNGETSLNQWSGALGWPMGRLSPDDLVKRLRLSEHFPNEIGMLGRQGSRPQGFGLQSDRTNHRVLKLGAVSSQAHRQGP